MSTPTPSLQSVAEAAAEEIRSTWAHRIGHLAGLELSAILTRHFAPLLAQYEQRVRELEGERERLDRGWTMCQKSLDVEHTKMIVAQFEVASLRTRCAELEEDKAALEKEVMRKEERFISCASNLECPNHCQISEPGNYIHLLKIFSDGSHVSIWKKTVQPALQEGESSIYPCAEWRDWMKDKKPWPSIPFKDYSDYRAQTAARTKETTP